LASTLRPRSRQFCFMMVLRASYSGMPCIKGTATHFKLLHKYAWLAGLALVCRKHWGLNPCYAMGVVHIRDAHCTAL
jgi:hypothetical protein